MIIKTQFHMMTTAQNIYVQHTHAITPQKQHINTIIGKRITRSRKKDTLRNFNRKLKTGFLEMGLLTKGQMS